MKPIETLDPVFREKVVKLLAKLKEETELDWLVVSGRRTMAQQQALYNQGRTTPGPIVTKAGPGQSAHNFGLAADLIPFWHGKYNYNAPDTIFKEMADIAQKAGFVAGYYFHSIHDADHIEDRNWRSVRNEWLEGKIKVE